MSSKQDKNPRIPLHLLGKFPEDWIEMTLSEVCSQVTDGTHDSPKPVALGGFPLVTGKAIKNREIDFSVTYNISVQEHEKVIERSKTERNDILFANIGNSIGDLVRVQTDRQFSIKNVALFKADPKIINPRFLEYYFLSNLVQAFIKGSTKGSAQPFIGLGYLRTFPVAVPKMEEQNWISGILGSLDDRISLLRETNATLEAIAQALFKSWFVDFDPVHAKQQGREPEGMDEATAALFPDSFEESELGLVPKGWRVEDLGKIIPVKDGTHESPKPAETGFPLVTSRHITSGQIDFSNTYLISEFDFLNISKRSRVDRFDVLITMIGTVGIPIIVLNEETDFAIKNIGLFKTSSKKDLSHYLYLLLCSNTMQSYLEARLAGTTQKYLSLKALREIEILLPSDEVLSSFSEIMFPLFNKIYGNQKLINTFTTTRDSLLPRLISGQLRLPEAETMLEEACA